MSERTITVSVTQLRGLLKIPMRSRVRVRLAMPLPGSDDALYVDVSEPTAAPTGAKESGPGGGTGGKARP